VLRPSGDPDRRKVLHHVTGLATKYGFNAQGIAAGVLEYRDVARTVLALREQGQPLAAASNPCVWSFVLSPAFECKGRVAPLRFLPKLIRWYISVEDGECSVERDLSIMRATIDTARTDDLATLEDTLLGRAGLPAARSDVVDPATGGCTELLRQWAKRWRAIHGARLGCLPPKAMAAARTKLKLKPTWTKYRKGVLAAAAGAVATEKALGGTCDATATPFGVPLGSLRRSATSVTGTSAYSCWTKKCANFAKVTGHRKTHYTNFLQNFRMIKRLGAIRPRKLQAVTGLCWLEPSPEDCPQVEHLAIHTGVEKCRYAHLVITDDISKLSDCQTLSTEKQLVIDFIYMVALGKPVITATAWRLANGRPNDVPALDIMRHVAVATSSKRHPVSHLNYTREFSFEHADIILALKRMTKLTDSRWRSIESATGLKTLSELVKQLLEIRRVENTLGKKKWTRCAVA